MSMDEFRAVDPAPTSSRMSSDAPSNSSQARAARVNRLAHSYGASLDDHFNSRQLESLDYVSTLAATSDSRVLQDELQDLVAMMRNDNLTVEDLSEIGLSTIQETLLEYLETGEIDALHGIESLY